MGVRLARCEGGTDNDDGTYTPCPGRLAFRPEDGDAACDTCGGRCGCLVADYVDATGPWPEAVMRWNDEVAELWRQSHAAGHPLGRGACPICIGQVA